MGKRKMRIRADEVAEREGARGVWGVKKGRRGTIWGGIMPIGV